MACKFIYQGKTFSRVEILTMIRDQEISAPLDQERARMWLNDKLGLTDEQVKIVKGLLDNGAYGSFLSDGNLLLSDQLEGVQYHEAFHRVFRMLLSESERQSLIDEFMKRKEAQLLLDSIAKRYPNESQATRVEEALAEEFMYYTLNDGRYPVEQVTKTLFEKIINFIKTILGINSTIPIRELYEAINAGKYRGIQPKTYSVQAANMLLLDEGISMSVEQKNEMMSFVFSNVMTELSDADLLYDFVEGNLPKDTFHNLFVAGIITAISPVDIVDGINEGGYGLIDTDEQLSGAILRDVFGNVPEVDFTSRVRPSSKLFAAFSEYASQFSVKLGMLDGDNTVKTTEELDDVSNENEQVGDNAFMKVSFEYDPRGNLNKAVKLLLASVPDVNTNGEAYISATLGLPKTMNYNEITKLIYNELAGVPANFEMVMSKLRSAALEYPSLNYIIDSLDNDSDNGMRLRTEFLAGLVKNKYTFQKSIIANGEHRYVNISDASQGGKYVQLWKNRLETGKHDVGNFTIQLLGTRDIAALTTLLGFDEINELGLLEAVFDEDTGQTVAQRISIIAGYAADALSRGININDLYDYRKNDDDISSSVRLLGEFVASKGIPFDMLLLNSERKRIFAISEHTYQTIIQGHLNTIADDVRNIADIQQRRKAALERIQLELPHLLHIENFDGRNVRSRFLKDILNGERINLFVMDGVDAYSSNETHFSKIGFTDYLSQYVNNMLHSKALGFKHGDRKVVYGYELNSPFVDQVDYKAIINDTVSLASEYLFDEIRRIRAIENNPNLTEGFANIDAAKNFQSFDFISYDAVKNAKNAEEVEKLVGDKLKTFFETQTTTLLKAITSAGLLERPEYGFVDGKDSKRNLTKDAGKVVGIDNVIYEKFKAMNGKDVDNAIAAYVSGNYFFAFIEQMRVFNGEPYNYKSFVDFYKRAQMQSSTGTTMMYGETIENYIQRLNAEDSFTVDGVERTYGVNDLKRRGYISEIVTSDQKFDSSAAVDLLYESPIDGTMVSLVQFLNERGVLMETGDPEIARKRALANVEAMRNYDENDGQSWINMFMWREYMLKAGKWSPQKQNTFQIELAVLQSDNIADTIVYVDNTYKDRFYAKERPDTTAVKIFDVADIKEKLDPKKGADSFLIRNTDYATVLKPQYTGPFTPNDPLRPQEEQLNIMAGRKTAYMVMLPSTVHGTKLELMNRMMLRKGLDANHMVSGAKFGRRKDVDGMIIYDADGYYNAELDTLADSQVSYLEFRYMKDQVNVSTNPKQEIKNATQSMKTMLQNMFNGGVPVDYKNEEQLWSDLTEEQKLEVSPIYQVYSDYRDNLYSFVKSAATELEREIGEGSRISSVLRKAAIDRQEARYILDSIEAFNENENIDTIPNGNRVENIMYSLVTKSAISLYRPGNGVPQVSTSLWESPDTPRITKDGRIVSENQAASFYGLRADGGLTPAKAIMPLEPRMIKMFLKKFNTTNIMEALDRYRELPDSEKFMAKSLRIPNQQFSFNDVFIIDRFTSPLTQSFIVVPSEIVPKTDADFDLDKQQIYVFARDTNGEVLQPIDGTTDEAALTRMRQWKTLSKLYLDNARDVLYDESITFGELEADLLGDLKLLKQINKKLKEDNNVKDRDSALNRLLADNLADIGDEYGIAGISIADLLDDISSQLDIIVDSGVFQPIRFKELLDAKEEIFDLFSEEREVRNENVENRALLYEALEELNAKIEEIELVDFMDKYPTIHDQIHPLVKHNMLLQSEIELLLHPTNAHKMVSSADDSYLRKQEFQRIASRLNGVSEEAVAKNSEMYTLGKMDSAEFLSVGGNAVRAVQMIGSKANVGPVALSITHHNIGQVDNASLNPTFNVVEQGKKIKVSSKLPIRGKDNDFSIAHVLTDDQQYILDLFSALLTAQVDGVNNPYAPKMNLTDVTLPAVLMMMRRGVNMPTILNIINNPLVRQVINAQNINDSLVYSASGYSKELGVKKGNVRLIESFLKKRGINIGTFTKYRVGYRNGRGPFVDPTKLEERLGQEKVTETDIQTLAAYMLIQEQARSLLTTVKDMGPDTNPKKDRADLVDSAKNYRKLIEGGITTTIHRQGFLKPFYENQQLYTKLFDKYYKLPHEQLDDIADILGVMMSSDDFRKMRAKLSEDFMVFLMQNYVEEISRYSAEELLQGNESFIHELSLMNSDNYAFKMLLPILNIGIHPVNGNSIHNVKIVDQGVATVSINDMYDEFQMLDDITQEKLIATSIYQSGISNSPFSLRTILDVGSVNSIMQKAVDRVGIFGINIEQGPWQTFINLFMRNNPQFLPRNEYAAKSAGLGIYAQRESTKGFFTIREVKGGEVVPVRGAMSPAILNYKVRAFDATIGEPVPVVEGDDFTSKPVETPVITEEGTC